MAQVMKSMRLYSASASLVMSGEAATLSGGKYYVTAAKQIFDLTKGFTVLDNGSPVNAANYTVNVFGGYVEFDVGYTVTGPVTINGYYHPKVELLNYNNVSIELERDEADDTCFDTQTGYRTKSLLLRHAMVSLDGLEAIQTTVGDNGLIARFNSDDPMLFLAELTPGDDSSRTGFGMWCHPTGMSESIAVADLLKSSLSLSSTIRDGDSAYANASYY